MISSWNSVKSPSMLSPKPWPRKRCVPCLAREHGWSAPCTYRLWEVLGNLEGSDVLSSWMEEVSWQSFAGVSSWRPQHGFLDACPIPAERHSSCHRAGSSWGRQRLGHEEIPGHGWKSNLGTFAVGACENPSHPGALWGCHETVLDEKLGEGPVLARPWRWSRELWESKAHCTSQRRAAVQQVLQWIPTGLVSHLRLRKFEVHRDLWPGGWHWVWNISNHSTFSLNPTPLEMH